ncbi:hypothetical protein HETIRDRAFT_418996 [Heterobasidion irregulare TC 32-1]|uniref:Uncharacterized protein n=1 Tax=Heterobasidion irregulare (strain TC 32-1) TaxID=747525 RepID=W4K5M7_HETIT|nr:uncharacterized protein HETIRDRAFT_418996 [Heterobasidion irregulare TC 32-1]ETW81069.1 hypothetical protein HETIRDRAFT_418996 [Heterobasidion irregulare TC 32-1]
MHQPNLVIESPYTTLSAWLQKYGMAGTGDTLDTSRSTLQDLSNGSHRWEFHILTRCGPGDTGIEGILVFLESRYEWIQDPLELPDDWKSTDDFSLEATLKGALNQYLDQFDESYVSFKPRPYFSNIDYPSSNVTFHEINDPTLSIYDVKWTLFKILSKCDPSMYTRYNELVPISLYSFVLPSVFYQIPQCDILRSVPIDFPVYSAAFGASVCIDFACKPSLHRLPNGLPDRFSPIIFAADYVDLISVLTDDELQRAYSDEPAANQETFPDRSQGIVKLAKIFEPALQLLVTYITNKFQINDREWRPEFDPFEVPMEMSHLRPDIPQDLFLYGMNYTKNDAMVYAFFPRYNITPSRRVIWGFSCAEAHRLPSIIASSSIRNRLDFFKTLLRIQRHTIHLAEIFKTISLSRSAE